MLTAQQLEYYEQNGFLVVEDVLDQASVIDPVRREYAGLLEDLYRNWQSEHGYYSFGTLALILGDVGLAID